MHCFWRKFCIFFKYSSYVDLSIFHFMQMFINAFIFHNIWTPSFWHFLTPVLSVFCIVNLCKLKFTSVLYRHMRWDTERFIPKTALQKPCQEPLSQSQHLTSLCWTHLSWFSSSHSGAQTCHVWDFPFTVVPKPSQSYPRCGSQSTQPDASVETHPHK